MIIRNPSINIPILQPEIAVVKPNEAPSFIEKTTETVLEWMNWLAESGKKYIVNPISSSLKNLRREYIIDGKPGYDPQKSFETIKSLILKILGENKNTKVKMILNCKMQRTDLRTGKIDEIVADFHSKIEINLGGTDENILLNEMIIRINENIANFQRRGSNWVFVSINQLEIHLVDFIPLGESSFIPLPK